jgi:hypothetical protein
MKMTAAPHLDDYAPQPASFPVRTFAIGLVQCQNAVDNRLAEDRCCQKDLAL